MAVLEIEELWPEVSSEVVDGALKLEKPEPALDFLRRPLDGDRETASSGRSLLATACAMSFIVAGSFSGGECLDRKSATFCLLCVFYSHSLLPSFHGVKLFPWLFSSGRNCNSRCRWVQAGRGTNFGTAAIGD